MKAIAAIALAAVCLPIIGQAPAAHLRHSGKWALPDRHATPGAVNPAVIADVTKAQKRVDGIEVNLCAPDFSASRIRATIRNFAGLKRKACAEYGVKRCDKSVEGDHLISIELGGCPDCLANLWPQPMGEAKIKDHHVEDVLPKLICAGRLSLKTAQRCIAKDWAACGKKWGGL